MNRREIITAGAAGAGSLILSDAAYAAKRHMGPRFDAELAIRHDGLTVRAIGPVGAWEWDAEYGYIAAVIVQGDFRGHGMSERVDRGDHRWHAQVVVDRHRFRAGSATAYGVLLMPDGREAYSYPWAVHVELVQR